MQGDTVHYFVLDGWPGTLRTDAAGGLSASIINRHFEEISVQVHEVAQAANMISDEEYALLLASLRRTFSQ